MDGFVQIKGTSLEATDTLNKQPYTKQLRAKTEHHKAELTKVIEKLKLYAIKKRKEVLQRKRICEGCI